MNEKLYRVSAFDQQVLFRTDTINIGDAAQTLAIRLLLEKIQIYQNNFIERYQLQNQTQKKTVITNGWYKEKLNEVFVNKNLDYKFVGIHLNTNDDVYKNYFYCDNRRIGCRDSFTRDKLKKAGLDAYTSLCLTLTFDKRPFSPKTQKDVIVNVRNIDVFKYCKNYKDYSNLVNGNEKYINNIVKRDDSKSWDFYEDLYLKRIKYLSENAKYVITDRVHTYLPCIALGIPVEYIGPMDIRTDIIKIVNKDTINILKPMIIQNFYYQVLNIGTDVSEMLDKTINELHKEYDS